MSYDNWKATEPDDRDPLDRCPECWGEGDQCVCPTGEEDDGDG